MEPVRQIVERNTIVIENAALRQGFTQIPNYVFKDKRLSFGARVTYGVLLSYAWQEGSCFPGQERMARDLGVGRQAVNAFLKELRRAGYVAWKRRGLGRTNVYRLLDSEADVVPGRHPEVAGGRHPDVAPGRQEEYSGE